MKTSVFFYLCIFFLTGFLLLTSCPGHDEIYPVPPDKVTATYQDSTVSVSWNAAENANHYIVYKSTGQGPYIKMNHELTTETCFTDPDILYGIDICYKVKSEHEGEYSDFSDASNIIFISWQEILTPQIPDVKSFVKENTLIIEWNHNEFVDSYLLYKETSPQGLFDFPYYEGTETLYEDTEVNENDFYYYKLAYKKDNVIYDFSAYDFGVPSSIVKDFLEENNNPDNAVIVYKGDTYTANAYYFNDGQGNLLVDEDWYYIVVPPLSSATIMFTDCDNALFSFCAAADLTAYPVYELDEFRLLNSGTEEKEIRFLITINSKEKINCSGFYTFTVE